MKKILVLFFVVCMSFFSCSENNTDPSPSQKDTPVVLFSYSLGGVALTDMTIVLTVDGQKYNFDKTSDEQSIMLTSTSGTIKLECTVDDSKTYTEKQDLSISVNLAAASIPADGKGYSVLCSIISHNVSLKGIKPDYVAEAIQSQAKFLNISKNYKVDSQGKISIE